MAERKTIDGDQWHHRCWDCGCEEDYIHDKFEEPICTNCGKDFSEQPDAVISEVEDAFSDPPAPRLTPDESDLLDIYQRVLVNITPLRNVLSPDGLIVVFNAIKNQIAREGGPELHDEYVECWGRVLEHRRKCS